MKSQKFPIFLINLNKRPERLISSIRELSKVKLSEYIVRKEGSDEEKSKRLKYEYITKDVVDNIDNNLVSTHILPTWGAVGCAISHIEIWREIINKNFMYCIIFEDDILIEDPIKFKINYNSAINLIKKNLDTNMFITLNSKTRYESDLSCDYPNLKKISNNSDIIGTSCYLINNTCARSFLEMLPITYQIDIQISRWKTYLESKKKTYYLIYTDSGITNKNFISDVQYYFINFKELHDILNCMLPLEIIEVIYKYLPKYENYNSIYNYHDNYNLHYYNSLWYELI